MCGSQGFFGKEAASFGGVYILESLADPITGNVAGRCASGDCQFNFSDPSLDVASKVINKLETVAELELGNNDGRLQKTIQEN